MRSGVYPSVEKSNGGTRAARPRRTRPQLGEVTQTFPVMSVVRQAEIANNTIVFAWDEFLNKLGANNRQRGRARALGSVGITLVKATEMAKMLDQHYDNYSRSPRDALELHRKVTSGVRDFLWGSGYMSSMSMTELVAVQHKFQAEKQEATEAGDIYIDSGRLSLAEQSQLDNHTYSELQLSVRGLALFGHGKLSVDLSGHEVLHEERSGLIKYFKGIGLNTSHIDPNWQPHAVIFDYMDHISYQPVNYLEADLPGTVMLRAPQTGPDLIA